MLLPEEGPHRSGGGVWSVRQPQAIIGDVVGGAVEVHDLGHAELGPLLQITPPEAANTGPGLRF